MKKLIPILLLAPVLFAFHLISRQQTGLAIGAKLPYTDRKMISTSGQTFSFDDAIRKNGLLVMFSCNTCPYVIKNQERTLEITRYAGEKGIGVVLLNANTANREETESLEAMKRYAKEQNYNFPYLVDEGSLMADSFGANRTPEVFLFNEKKMLVYHGAIDDNPGNPHAIEREHLRIAINEMLAHKSVSVTTTRSVGCAIKRKS